MGTVNFLICIPYWRIKSSLISIKYRSDIIFKLMWHGSDRWISQPQADLYLPVRAALSGRQ